MKSNTEEKQKSDQEKESDSCMSLQEEIGMGLSGFLPGQTAANASAQEGTTSTGPSSDQLLREDFLMSLKRQTEILEKTHSTIQKILKSLS